MAQEQQMLKRGLKNRHIQLIALGAPLVQAYSLGLQQPYKWQGHLFF